MRTTVTIDPDVEILLKTAMRQRDASFKQVLNDGLRVALSTPRKSPPQPFRQLTFTMGRPLVELTKATALAGELEDQERLSRLRAQDQP